MTRPIAFLFVAAILLAAPAWATAEPPAVPIKLGLVGQQHIDHATHHVQGLAVSVEWYWISSVDRASKKGFVYRVDRVSGKVVQQRELAFGEQFHPGGVDRAGSALWVPVAEYRPRSSSTIVKLDPKTLETRASFTVDDHIGCLAVAAAGGIIAANWDARVFYRFTAEGKKLAEVANRRAAKYQDMKMLGEHILAAGTETVDGRQTAVIDRLDPTTFELVSRWQPTGTMRTGGSNFCREGCAVFDGQLFLMPEDEPNTTIYRFAVPRS